MAAAVIVGTVLLSLGASFGMSVLLWQHVLGLELHWMVLPMSVILLLAVGSDYNLLLVSRFKEELHGGLKTGIIRAMAGTGSVVTSAGLVFAFTMASFAFSDLTVMAQVGTTIALGAVVRHPGGALVHDPGDRRAAGQVVLVAAGDPYRGIPAPARGAGHRGRGALNHGLSCRFRQLQNGALRPSRQLRSGSMPETSYAPCGELSLAYQMFGAGPVDLVFVGPMVSHIELFWTMPEFKSFFDQLGTFCRVLLFDKAGVGSVGSSAAGAHPRRSGGRDRGRHGCRRLRAGRHLRHERRRGAGDLFRGETAPAHAGADRLRLVRVSVRGGWDELPLTRRHSRRKWRSNWGRSTRRRSSRSAGYRLSRTPPAHSGAAVRAPRR